MTNPTVAPAPAAGNTPSGNATPVVHTHPVTAITGLRFDAATGRVEPIYDSSNVRANGVVIALYNAATTTGSFSAPTVPRVTITAAIQNVEGATGNKEGKQQADEFLANGRITPAEHKEITAPAPAPTTAGVAPGAVVPGKPSSEVAGAVSFASVLTPKGTTLGDLIKNVTFPRTIQQLETYGPTVTSSKNVVNNLAALALNVWEPIKAQYPTAIITNTYRHRAVDSKGNVINQNQHGTGQAVDIQFRGLNSWSYYNIAVWISKNLPYDQLLLEYQGGKRPTVWIHVSYAIPGLTYGGIAIAKINKLATLNAAGGAGSFVVNLHENIVRAAVPNIVVAA